MCVQRSSSLWPSYALLAVVFGGLALTSGPPALAVFTVVSAWLLWTLVLALHRDLARNWRLAGPAKWACAEPLVSAIGAGTAASALVAAAGGVLWRSAVIGTAYALLLGLSGVLIRRGVRGRDA